MSCQVQTSKHLEFVKGLVKYDPKLYFNFDNAAKFILQSDLTPELKKISVHNVALIYKTLDLKQPNVWTLGNAEKVLSSEHLIDDTKNYMKAMSDMFSTKVPGIVTIETVNKAIDALAKKSTIVEGDLVGVDGVISMFNNFLASHSMPESEIENARTQFKASVTKAINEVLDGSAAKYMIDLLNARMDIKKATTPYIPMSDIAELAKLQPVIITLNDRTVVEGIVEDDVVKAFNADGTYRELKVGDYISYGEISYQSEGNSIELVLAANSINSHLVIKAANPAKQAEVMDAIQKSANLRSDVEIFAINLNTADARLERIRTNTPTEVGDRRRHETFENASQIEYLSTNPAGSVVSVARPNFENNLFSIVGVIKSTGEIFNVYSFDNYVSVDSNNNTRVINLDNKEDKDLFKNKVLKSTNEGAVAINNVDIATINNAVKTHRAFKTSLFKQIGSDLNTEGSVNITSEFFDTYNFNVKRDVEDVRLDRILGKDKTLSLPLAVATLDADGSIVSTEDRNIPFTFIKINDVYTLNSFLGANERIIALGEDGTDQKYTEEEYFKSILEKIPGYESGALAVSKFITNEILKGSPKESERISIRFNAEGIPFSYAPINTKKAFQDLGNFGIMFSQLYDIIQEKDEVKKSEKLKQFQKFYRFAGGKNLFYIDFVNLKDSIQLRLNPTATADVYNEMMLRASSSEETEEGKKKLLGNFYFPLEAKDLAKFKTIFTSIQLSSATHKAILAEIPSLSVYNVATPEGKADFITALSELADEGLVGNASENFLQNLASSRKLFSQFLVDHVIGTLEARTEKIPGFMEQIKQDFTWKGKVHLDRLLVYDRDGEVIPYMTITRENKQGTNRFYKNMKNWTVVKTSFPYVNVVNQAAPALEEDTKELLKAGMSPEVISTPGTFSSPAPVEPPVNQEVIKPEVKVDSEKILLSLASDGFKSAQYSPGSYGYQNAFDPRKDIIQDLMATRKSFAQIIEYKNKNWLVVGLTTVNDIDNAITSGRDNYSFATIEFNESLPNDIIETLEKAAKEHFKTNRNFNESEPIKPITDIDSRLFNKSTENNSDEDIISEENYSKGFKLEEGAFRFDTISDEQIKLQIAEVRKMLPQFEIDESALEDVLKLMSVDGTVLGLYKDRVIYLNDKLKVSGVVYHEAFHAVFRNFMNNEFRRELLDKVINSPKHASKFTEAAKQDFARRRGMVYNSAKITDLIAEEVLADGFQDYMLNKKKAPKGLLGQLFEMLKRLIALFVNNKTDIENLYGKISDGYYAKAVINAELYKGETAFELIPTVNRLYSELNKTVVQKRNLESKDQNQLVNFMVREMINLGKDAPATFDEKFDVASKKVLDEIFNVEKIVASNPENAQQIREALSDRFNQMRFVLGARLLENDLTPPSQRLYDTNATGNDSFGAKVMNIKNDEGKDNTLGQESRKVLKKLVQKRLQELVITSNEDPESISISKVEEFLNDPKYSVDTNEDTNDDDEVSEESFEKSINEISRIDGIPAEFRKFISTMRRDIYDEELGVYIPNMVDAKGIFNQLLKVTSNKYAEELIPHLEYVLKQNKEDYNSNEFVNDLEAVINEIKKLSNTNSQLYNLIINVLHGSELDLMFVRLSTADNSSENMSDEELISGPQETRVRIFEQLETADANETKKNFIASMTIANATRYKSPENEAKYKEALQAIQQITVDIKNNLASNNSILGELNPNKKLNSIVDELHESLNTIGLNLPKSLIKMSVLAMEVYENGKTLDKVSAENKIAYDNNQDIIRANNYLESGFFSALNEIAKAGLANKPFKGLIDDTSDRVIAYVQTFNNVLRRSSVYINKYNPAYIPSVVRNAENKPIYRYVKYTPLLSMALDIRRKGVLEAIKSDDEKVFNDFLNDYFKDHPMFDDFFNGNETSDKAKVINVLLDNMRIAMSGGAQQRIGEIYKDGKTFKGLDTKSALLFNLLMFMNRNTETGQKLSSKDEYAKLQLYLRNFGQLESSGTNFMMPAIYTKHVEEAKLKNKEQSFSIKKDGGHYAASKELLKVIRQEYERIRREWNKQAERADAFRNGDNQYVDGYNAKMSSSGEIITDDLSLRAYNFRKLDDAFNTDPELREQILSKARANVPFDSLLSEEYAEILYTLDEYINDQVKEQIAIYENAGVIKKEKAIVYTLPAGLKTEGLSEQEILDKRVPKDRTYYSSDFIPKNFKTDVGVKNTEINSAYGSGLKLFGKESSSTPNPTNYEALIADMYINDLINGVMFKDLFVGDEALGIKSVQDMLKRAKQYLATGDNGKEGYHKIAIANTYLVFIHNDYRTKGPFATIDEINDAEQYELSKPGANVDAIEEMYKNIREGFTAAYDNSNVEHKKYKKMLTKIFDGQSYALIMHQMDFLDSRGRLNESAKELLIASHYRSLTASEIYKLENLKTVLNSQKTVTSSRVDYIKMSEGVILRSSVSRLKDDMIDARLATMPEGSTREDAIDSIHENLHDEWSAVYSMRKQIQELSKTESIHNSDSINALEQDIKETIKNIHSYYRPVESRMMLHNILNAMEYHQIDHFMDTESSKTMTYLQSSTGRNALEQAVKMEAGYLPINTNARWIQNKHKYAQVETSGVSDTAKFSVQSKVLAPADVDNLAEIISKTQGRTLTADETEQLNSITKRLLQDYEGALKDSTAGRLLYLTNILREGGDFKIAKVYDLIRENLAAQGATPALLAMFEVVGDKPKYSPNLPQLRKVLEYYFFSQYSKNVTDEKGSGGKYIHISSLGYNVYEDVNTGKVIPTDVYEANPEAYEVRTRPLSVTQEDSIDADGNPVTTYFAEVILPKPLVDNPDFMAFYEQYLTKMFATRIPTEDKRSMIVLKAVDYLDSSNMNGIVVPHFIHLLVG